MRSTRRYHISEFYDQEEVYQSRLGHSRNLRKTTISFDRQRDLESSRKLAKQRQQKNHTLKHIRLTLLKRPAVSPSKEVTEEFLSHYKPAEKNRWIEVPPIRPRLLHSMEPHSTLSVTSRSKTKGVEPPSDVRTTSCKLPPTRQSTDFPQFMLPKPRVMFSRAQPKQTVLLNNSFWALE